MAGHKLVFLIACILHFHYCHGIESTIKVVIQDQETQAPIKDVHIFVHHTLMHTQSGAEGEAQLTADDFMNQDLVCYHPDYHLVVIPHEEYEQWSSTQVISLSVRSADKINGFDIPFGKRKWKRGLKELEKALIGTDFISKKCALVNPEVLAFSNKEGQWKAYADDMLVMRNPKLLYELNVVVEHLKIENRQTDFKGYFYFRELAEGKDFAENITSDRLAAYNHNIRSFFKLLLLDQLDQQNIKIRICRFEKNQFQSIIEPDVADLFKKSGDYFHIRFPEFLEVVHQNIRNISEEDQPNFGGGPLGQRYDNTYRIERINFGYGVTYFYNLGSSLQINRYGAILNPEEVKIYGYWARPRLGMELPYEFQ